MRWWIMGALLALAGCEPYSTGGAGSLASGAPVSGLLVSLPAFQGNEARIISPSGWTCTSRFGPSDTPGMMVRSVPLTCDDGRTGNLVLTGNQIQAQVVGSFALSDGTQGQVTFGRL